MNGSHLLCVTRRFLYWLVRHSQSERVFVTEFIEQHLCLYSTSKSNSGSFLKHRFYVDRLIFEFLFRHKIKRSHWETMTSNSTRHLMCKKVLPMNTTTQMKKEKKNTKTKHDRKHDVRNGCHSPDFLIQLLFDLSLLHLPSICNEMEWNVHKYHLKHGTHRRAARFSLSLACLQFEPINCVFCVCSTRKGYLTFIGIGC